MAKITLAIEPTFQAPVKIPVPGGESEPIKFTFKHRTKDELEKHIADVKAKQKNISELDLVMSMVEGWELTDEFNRGNVEMLLQKYHGAAAAISNTYVAELKQARLGN